MNKKVLSLVLIGLFTVIAGCSPVQYHLPDHPGPYAEDGSMKTPWPDVTMKVGQTIDAVTPARTLGPTGYWTTLYILDPTIVRAVSVDDSFLNGTKITALKPGRTAAVYTNAAFLNRNEDTGEVSLDSNVNMEPDFWIIVEE